MRINRQEARQMVASLGLRLVYDVEYMEWQVKVPGKPEATYFTNDLQDALGTAKTMSEKLGIR